VNIFYLAQITGKAGVWAVKKNIAEIKRSYQPDFIIANADMATGTGGLGRQHAGYLKKMGIDCITGGDCIFQKKDLVESLSQMPFVLRPFNFPAQSPGQGVRYFSARNGEKLAVFSLLGRVGHHRLLADNPFTAMQAALPEIEKETPFIIADFSSFATAEKQTMAFFLAGRISALIGSGTGAATADCRLIAGDNNRQVVDGYPLSMTTHVLTDAESTRIDRTSGMQEVGIRGAHPRSGRKTAYITDAGRTGSFDSVGGYAPAGKIREYRTGLFEYRQEIWQRVCVQGVHIELNGDGGARSIERVRLELSPLSDQRRRENSHPQ